MPLAKLGHRVLSLPAALILTVFPKPTMILWRKLA